MPDTAPMTSAAVEYFRQARGYMNDGNIPAANDYFVKAFTELEAARPPERAPKGEHQTPSAIASTCYWAGEALAGRHQFTDLGLQEGWIRELCNALLFMRDAGATPQAERAPAQGLTLREVMREDVEGTDYRHFLASDDNGEPYHVGDVFKVEDKHYQICAAQHPASEPPRDHIADVRNMVAAPEGVEACVREIDRLRIVSETNEALRVHFTTKAAALIQGLVQAEVAKAVAPQVFEHWNGDRPNGSNADEWELYLLEHRSAIPYAAVQIAEAIEAAGRKECNVIADAARNVIDAFTKYKPSIVSQGAGNLVLAVSRLGEALCAPSQPTGPVNEGVGN